MRITREERARTGDDGIIAVCFVNGFLLNLIPHKFIIITFNKKGADTVIFTPAAPYNLFKYFR